ncbi:hypothetical protein [Paenibacillus paeoniae]|uniref:hypothetical protein n=1 Tax=Paenibacillus paeoniae TaxID=2292705 RepID=UPI0014020725|nr:hypothetical protein [Paenibacillus paeoniae]
MSSRLPCIPAIAAAYLAANSRASSAPCSVSAASGHAATMAARPSSLSATSASPISSPSAYNARTATLATRRSGGASGHPSAASDSERPPASRWIAYGSRLTTVTRYTLASVPASSLQLSPARFHIRYRCSAFMLAAWGAPAFTTHIPSKASTAIAVRSDETITASPVCAFAPVATVPLSAECFS